MAIEPIKGFYVHDEVTNTDGVAKYDYDSLVNAPDFEALENRVSLLDGFVSLDKSRLVLGNVNASTSGWVYQVRNYGVITEQGYTFPLNAGATAFLSDYTSYKLALNWRTAGGAYGTSGWITSGTYTTTVSGDYIINVQLKDTSGTANIEDVYNILNIFDSGEIAEIETEIAELKKEPTNANLISNVKILNTYAGGWGQSATKLKDYILMCHASNDAHTNHSQIDVYGANDLTTRLFYIEHNLGHCASADYNEETDTLLIANGSTDSTIDDFVFLVPNISTVLENRTNLEFTDTATVKRINISALSGGGAVACFGENSNIVYVVKTISTTNYDTELTKYFYQLSVGRGETDLVTLFPNASVGTYGAEGAGVPNGSARILKSGDIELYGELQGLKFNGQLILLTDSRKLLYTVKTPYFYYIDCTDSFYLSKIKCLYITNENGNVVENELEDIVITENSIAYTSTGYNKYKIMI